MMFLGLQVGSWSDLFGAVGTIGAVGYALFSDKMQKKLNLKIYANMYYVSDRIIEDDGEYDFTQIDFIIKNVGVLDTKIGEIIISKEKLKIEDIVFGYVERDKDKRICFSLKFGFNNVTKPEVIGGFVNIPAKSSTRISSRDCPDFEEYLTSEFAKKIKENSSKNYYVYVVDNLNEVYRGKIKSIVDSTFLPYEKR